MVSSFATRTGEARIRPVPEGYCVISISDR